MMGVELATSVAGGEGSWRLKRQKNKEEKRYPENIMVKCEREQRKSSEL